MSHRFRNVFRRFVTVPADAVEVFTVRSVGMLARLIDDVQYDLFDNELVGLIVLIVISSSGRSSDIFLESASEMTSSSRFSAVCWSVAELFPE